MLFKQSKQHTKIVLICIEGEANEFVTIKLLISTEYLIHAKIGHTNGKAAKHSPT